MQRESQREQGREGTGDQSARGLTGMSFSAWFSALGRPFFLPSVLSLVAFPANRCSTRLPLSGQPCRRSCCPGNPASLLAPSLCVGSTSSLDCHAPALAKPKIPLWKAMPAPLQFSAQPLHLQIPALVMAASPGVCRPRSFHLHRADSAQLQLALETHSFIWVGRNPSTTMLLSKRNLHLGQHAGPWAGC